MSNNSVGTLLKSALAVSVATVALASLAGGASAETAGTQGVKVLSIADEGASALADGDVKKRKNFRIRPSKGDNGDGSGGGNGDGSGGGNGDGSGGGNGGGNGFDGFQQIVVPKGDNGDGGDTVVIKSRPSKGDIEDSGNGGGVQLIDEPVRQAKRPRQKERVVEQSFGALDPVAFASPENNETETVTESGSTAFLDPSDNSDEPQTVVPGGAPLMINGIDISKIKGVEPGDKLVIRTEGDKTIITIIKSVKAKVHKVVPTYSYSSYKYVYPRYKHYNTYNHYKYKYVKPYKAYKNHYNYGHKSYGYKYKNYKNYGHKSYGHKYNNYKNYGYKSYGHAKKHVNYGKSYKSYGYAKKSYAKGY